MKATVYHRPDGRREEIEVTHINPEDAKWFEDNEAEISLESDGMGGIIVYADIGIRTEDGEPVEMIELAMGDEDAHAVFAALRKQCEEAKS